ncbi:MAG: hypothetical protein AABX08_02460 [Nanoarchaeota archaeon]
MIKALLAITNIVVILMVAATYAQSYSVKELHSPRDRIKEDQIHVFRDRIVIDVEGASWSKYANTNSMDPFIDEGANGIEIMPESEDELYVGDVVAYESQYVQGLTVHRIVEIGNDGTGKYFVLKGDNLDMEDPEKVRFSQIKYVLIGVIY